MKVILIAWFIVSGETSGAAVTAEFDSMEACQNAAQQLRQQGNRGAGKNVKWRHDCAPKQSQVPGDDL
jgi:hypothetical protein